MRLTDVEEIADVVSRVTETFCGATFESWDPLARGESLSGRILVMALEGPRPIRIALACDSRGGRLLAAAVFRIAHEAVTPQKIDDAITQLLSVVADQVQQVLGVHQPLGTPRPTTLAELGAAGTDDAVLLRSHGDVDLRLWILEEQPASTAAGAPGSVLSRFRSLVKRIKR